MVFYTFWAICPKNMIFCILWILFQTWWTCPHGGFPETLGIGGTCQSRFGWFGSGIVAKVEWVAYVCSTNLQWSTNCNLNSPRVENPSKMQFFRMLVCMIWYISSTPFKREAGFCPHKPSLSFRPLLNQIEGQRAFTGPSNGTANLGS